MKEVKVRKVANVPFAPISFGMTKPPKFIWVIEFSDGSWLDEYRTKAEAMEDVKEYNLKVVK